MFINNWPILAGVLAAAAPVIVHWLTRPRPTRLPVSTLRFIRGAIHQRRSAARLRDVLVLLCRTAAILLIAAALARPLFHQVTAAPAALNVSVTRIVLLDCSLSMAVREGGVTRFERARPVAVDELTFRPSLAGNLLLAGAVPGKVFDECTTNIRALREALSTAVPRPERLKVQPALNAAAELLSHSAPESHRELVIVSDFQRENWASADFSVLPEDCQIQLRSVASAESVPNLSVMDLNIAGRVQAGRETDFTVRVGNWSDTPRYVRLELKLKGAVVPLEGTCAPRSATSLAGTLPALEPGWRSGTLRILEADDSLPDDDWLPVSLSVSVAPRVALVTREREDRKLSASWFVAHALQSQTGLIGGTGLVRLDGADPDLDAMRAVDAMVFVRPGRLTADTVTVLSAMLRRGRGVLYIGADQLDAVNLVELTRSLGASGRLPVEFLPRDSGLSNQVRLISDVDRAQSPFSAFGDELGAAIRSLEFRGGLLTRPLSEGLRTDIRASFDDRSTFLTSTAVDRGRLVVMNVDLDQSTLPRTPVFVPLLGELLSGELAGGGQAVSTAASGEAALLNVAAGEEKISELSIHGPADIVVPESARGRLVQALGGVTWDISAAGPPGVYEVKLGTQTVAGLATVIPVEESDLRALPENVFSERLSGGRKLHYSQVNAPRQDEQDRAWVWMAAGCLFCLLAELTALRTFRT